MHRPQLKENKLLSDQEINMIFSNTEQLIQSNQALHAKMIQRKEVSLFISEIGDVVADAAEVILVLSSRSRSILYMPPITPLQ